MSDPRSPDGPEARVDAVLAAWTRYRAARACDGGEDEGDGISCLLEHAAEIEDMAAHHRRRIELIERATEEEWMDREMAEEVYDIAREEGLEPAFAFELVRCGVAVCEPEGPEPIATTSVKGRPEWLSQPVPTEEATRERRLRMSFRRLRSFLEEYETPEEALIAFAQEPDVRACGY